MMEVRNSGILRSIPLLITICLLSFPVYAQYGGGTGEPNDPYLIYTAEQMNTIGAEPNDWGRHFKLMADIDLSGIIYSTAVIPEFTGVFDGNGHKISYFTYSSTGTNRIGLFGHVSGEAEIKDLGLIDTNIHAETGDRVGSLVGYLEDGTITACYVEGGIVSGNDYVGGLVGAHGMVAGFEPVGPPPFTISNCYSTAIVVGRDRVGGLAGSNYRGLIDNCYAMGSVFGVTCVGGLAGDNGAGTIINCYSTGDVSGNDYVGGLVGRGITYKVVNSFWDTETSGQATSAGGTGKTTAQMQDPSTIKDAGWDFAPHNIWAEPDSGWYPILWWQLSPLPDLSVFFSGGTGEPDDPYLISGADELNSIGHNPRLMAAHYKLIDDIDLTGIEFFIIGNELFPFTGVFDGSGHKISNFNYSSTDTNCIGLFGYVYGENVEIKDLGLIGPNIDAGTGDYIGSLVGCLSDGTITGCYVEGGTVKGDYNVGGLVGACGKEPSYVEPPSTISNCYSTSSVQGTRRVGGLVGSNYEGLITNCYATGSVPGTWGVGGLVGNGDPIRVHNSFWDVESSGLIVSAGGVGLTTAEMMDPEMLGLNGWGGGPNWVLDSGQDYPRLFWEGTPGQMIPEPVIDWLDGSGTQDDPFQIENADQLLLIHKSSLLWNKHFVLNADIDLDPNLIGHNVFGRAVIPTFEGSFVGNGHVILNLQIEGGDCRGMFGHLKSGAEVRDLGVLDVSITGSGYDVGGLVGRNAGTVTHCYSNGLIRGYSYVGGLVGNNEGHVLNCYSEGEVRGIRQYVGGLVGYNNGSDVTACYSTGLVNGDKYVGGLVGYNRGDLTDCYSDGGASGDSHVGGLVGYSNSGSVLNCNSKSEVSGTGQYVGGLIGSNFRSSVTHCYSAGVVRGDNRAGGLVGGNGGSVLNCYSTGEVGGEGSVGGLVGENCYEYGDYVVRGSVTNSYSTGTVSGHECVGGLAGINGGRITNTYSASSVSGREYVGGLVGKNWYRFTENCMPIYYGGGVTNSYSSGAVSGDEYVSGLVVCRFSDAIIDSFWDTETSGQQISNCGTGKSTAEMQMSVTFNDWVECYIGKSRGVWTIDEGNDYPRLWWEDKPGHVIEPMQPCPMHATNPSPPDGGVYGDTSVNLSWKPGVCAASHRVYFGDNFDDVNDGTGGTFQGNQVSMSYVAGLTGSAYPDGLVPGTTYYWRIDEVNNIHSESPWKGDVWSFTVPHSTAFNPGPPDGAIHKYTWVSLSWSPGDYAVSHRVYFGDNFDDVKDGIGSTFLDSRTSTSYVVGLPGSAYPDGLVPGTTYYWRIDELTNLHPGGPWKGDVWSFTIPHWIAFNPSPPDGALHEDTWVSLSWTPGGYAVSHDVYFGKNFDDVNDGIADTFQGNQTETFFVAGFPGFAYPEGLVPGTTYYWRIDEVNDTEPNSPWQGDVWSFNIPPKIAYNPDPSNGTESVELDAGLSWTPGFGTKLHIVYFGDNFDEIDNAAGGLPQGDTTYTPGSLELAKTYYWRVDEFDAVATHKGDVWSFITQGAVGSPEPANGAVDVKQIPILTWTHGIYADSHQVYFGYDTQAVKNADTSSPEFKGSGNLGSESYVPGKLQWDTTYYWRVDEVNNANADSPWTGPVWSFTTANFIIVDDFESYNDLDYDDPKSNRIFLAWIDGFDNPAINGSIVGDYWWWGERTIVHGGNQSMPFYYDNAVGKSEATMTLTSNRDWTENGVDTLAIWYRGKTANAAETMYVVLNGSAGVDNDNPNAAQEATWTEWRINLQEFADQGVNLANVNSITLGFGNRNNPVAGGSGEMWFDDIRLYRPARQEPEPEP